MALLSAAAVVFLTLSALHCGFVVRAQSDSDGFRVFGGLGMEEEEERFRGLSNAEKLPYAARSGETQIVEITGDSQIAIAQDESAISVDCFPWLQQFPGGSIQWFKLQLDEFNQPIEGNTFEPQDAPSSTQIQTIGGDFNRWFNLTSIEIAQGARDPDSVVIRCEVCVARGTPFESCYAANYTNQVIGAPPRLDAEPFPTCIRPGDNFNLGCGIFADVPRPVPVPTRNWTKDGELIYSETDGDEIEVENDFYVNNMILTPGILPGDPLTALVSGTIQYTTSFLNPNGNGSLDFDDLLQEVFEAALGEWTCTVTNELGSVMVSSTIRPCGPPITFPDCSSTVPVGGTLFPEGGEVFAPGCTICLQEGTSVTLDCTATSGTTPITYTWTSNITGEVMITESARLTVTQPGSYSCNATNADEAVQQVSVLSFSPRAELEVKISGRDSLGCDRLDLTQEEREMLDSDVCPFVGETVDVECSTNDETAALEVLVDGLASENTSFSVVASGDQRTEYSCRVSSIEGPCGEFRFMSTVRVYDPARISRNRAIAEGTFGVGREEQAVRTTNGSTITLQCPTSGIPEENTTWYRVVEEEGCYVEREITDSLDDRYTVNTDLDGSMLIISPFIFEDEGTYVCRTSNIAGNDADSVSVVINTGVPEFVTARSECDRFCVDGIRNQSFYCRNTFTRNTLPDFDCTNAGLTPPASTLSCQFDYPLPCFDFPIWIPGPWSRCSVSCNEGYRRREVPCRIPMTGDVMPNYSCSALTRPHTVEFCGPSTCCKGDAYSNFCKKEGTGKCGLPNFQQICCWTCGLTEMP